MQEEEKKGWMMIKDMSKGLTLRRIWATVVIQTMQFSVLSNRWPMWMMILIKSMYFSKLFDMKVGCFWTEAYKWSLFLLWLRSLQNRVKVVGPINPYLKYIMQCIYVFTYGIIFSYLPEFCLAKESYFNAPFSGWIMLQSSLLIRPSDYMVILLNWSFSHFPNYQFQSNLPLLMPIPL